MNKYQETMSHIEVDEEMKKRILQNVQDRLEKEAGTEGGNIERFKAAEAGAAIEQNKTKTRKNNKQGVIVFIKRFGSLAAIFAILFLGVSTAMRITGGRPASSPSYSTSSSYDSTAGGSAASTTTNSPAYEAEVAETAITAEEAKDSLREDAADMAAEPADNEAPAAEAAEAADSGATDMAAVADNEAPATSAAEATSNASADTAPADVQADLGGSAGASVGEETDHKPGLFGGGVLNGKTEKTEGAIAEEPASESIVAEDSLPDNLGASVEEKPKDKKEPASPQKEIEKVPPRISGDTIAVAASIIIAVAAGLAALIVILIYMIRKRK
ncbi:MAG: hypothetical protein IJ589_06220 [Lachnospiraceae bacterium]|nr:hypothetical protein [Lachnospiraceae bacterium]